MHALKIAACNLHVMHDIDAQTPFCGCVVLALSCLTLTSLPVGQASAYIVLQRPSAA